MKKTDIRLWEKITAGTSLMIFCAAFLAVSVFMTGCQKKQEQPEQQNNTQQQQTDTTAQAAADTAKKADTLDKADANVPDLKGTWSGKMGAFRTTLKITEQTENEFKGSITMSFRDPIKQQVSGKLDPATGKLNMRDVLKQRYQGRYNGKVSAGDKLTGTYTLADGQSFNFNLSKK